MGTMNIKEGDRYLLGLHPHNATIFTIKKINGRKSATGKEEISVYFDREWVDDNMETFVYKIPSPLDYEIPFVWLSYKLQASLLFQGPLKCFVVANHLIAAFLTSLASKYDDDSPTSVRLHSASRLFFSNKEKASRKLFKFIEVNEKDYEFKAIGKQAQRKVIQFIEEIQKFLQEKKRKQPYELWEMSTDKIFLLVLWRVLTEERKEEMNQLIGKIYVDVDAPLSILREKIRRDVREALNEKNGEGFLFLVSWSMDFELDV